MTTTRYPVLALALVACTAASPNKGVRSPRASEHLQVAREHDEQAHQMSAYPDRRHDGTGRADGMPSGLEAWTRRWDTAADHQRLAQVHRSAAAMLQAEYHEACGDRPHAQVSVSPLRRYGMGGTPTPDGVVVYLTPNAGAPDQLMAELRCHRAWMMLEPSSRTGMELCPLDLEGIQVGAVGDDHEIVLILTVRDRTLIPELQRRTAIDLEVAARQR